MTVAIVPLRGGQGGKSRLAAAIGVEERARLVDELARHVVRVLLEAEGVDEVRVVTTDVAGVAAMLAAPDVRMVAQDAERPGLDAAIDLARSAGPAPRAVLVVHADLPELTPDDVAALLAAPGDVVIATDRHGTGTNALLLRGSAVGMPTRFGVGSRAAHERGARSLGLEPVVVVRRGTAADVDTPDDLLERASR